MNLSIQWHEDEPICSDVDVNISCVYLVYIHEYMYIFVYIYTHFLNIDSLHMFIHFDGGCQFHYIHISVKCISISYGLIST